MAAACERFRKSHRIGGTAVGVEGLHLTLCPMGRSDQLRRPLEEALLAAGAEVHERGFTATLDAAMRFTARDGQFPFVLCADGPTNEATLGLRKAIAAAQARAGLHVSGVSSFLPHVSLLHGHAIDAIEESMAPIQWRVSDFVLIRSFFGESRFEVVGRWQLAEALEKPSTDLLDELANMPDLPDLPDAY